MLKVPRSEVKKIRRLATWSAAVLAPIRPAFALHVTYMYIIYLCYTHTHTHTHTDTHT
jgi:hypothetical protein